MKRKETNLENKLLEMHYKLSHKTYSGKHSDKINTYVYVNKVNDFTFYVELDKNRDKIVTYYFESGYSYKYNGAIINTIREIYDNFYTSLCVIYDFVEEKVVDDPCIDLEYTTNSPFVEEAHFDEED